MHSSIHHFETKQMNNDAYGFTQHLANTNLEEGIERITEELGTVGFGVLTRIDVHTTLKAKLDKDFRPYAILGACNPGLAIRALEDDPLVGLLMPCNVVVQTQGDGVDISSIDPDELIQFVGEGETATVMREAGVLLRSVFDKLQS
jgi:uncharacterized protein (DUF302 family)